MELDDSEMSRWCLETAKNGDASDVMKTLEASVVGHVFFRQADVGKLNMSVCEVERQTFVSPETLA